ncbi:MAG: protein translocase subunit SecF, partial [Myxococcota bacterium]
RIRENWQKSRVDFGAMMNRSINETLSRTLLTSITTFLAVTPIYVLGGSNIRWFAFAMMFGILIGTYSSVAIASPIVYYLNEFFSRQERVAEEEAADKRERRRLRRKGITTASSAS